MVKFILICLIMTSSGAEANLFDFNSSKGRRESKLPAMIENLKSIKMKDDPAFEDSFNQAVKAIENGVEEEKLFCSGDVTDAEGKTLPPAQKQLCIRELKKHYIDAMSAIYEMKKKYLIFIHTKQIQKLSEIQGKLKEDIEKKF